ncbi:hypothetical protein [Helicobacter pylori]|nr:hypothetical protein [Helicobacter pylori]UOR63113.1 hypothetical protein MPG55_05035 [Helicobacter pylori]
MKRLETLESILDGYVKQDYLEKPLDLVSSQGIGFEKTLLEWLDKIRN